MVEASYRVKYDSFVTKYQSFLNLVARIFEDSPFSFSGTLEIDTQDAFISKFLFDCGFSQTKHVMNDNQHVITKIAKEFNSSITTSEYHDVTYLVSSALSLRNSSAYCPVGFSFRSLSKLDDITVQKHVKSIGSVVDKQIHYVPGFNTIDPLEKNERLRTLYSWDNLLSSYGKLTQITWDNRNHHILIIE